MFNAIMCVCVTLEKACSTWTTREEAVVATMTSIVTPRRWCEVPTSRHQEWPFFRPIRATAPVLAARRRPWKTWQVRSHLTTTSATTTVSKNVREAPSTSSNTRSTTTILTTATSITAAAAAIESLIAAIRRLNLRIAWCRIRALRTWVIWVVRTTREPLRTSWTSSHRTTNSSMI